RCSSKARSQCGDRNRLGYGQTSCGNGTQAVRRIADQRRPTRVSPLHGLQQCLPNSRKHVHMLMPVDVVRWSPHRELEAVELATDLGPNLVDVEEAEQGPCEETAQPRERAGGCQSRHRPERRAERQIEV